MTLEKNSYFKFLLLIAVCLFFFCRCNTISVKQKQDNLKIGEEYFAKHFMIDLDTIDIEFNPELSPTFELVGSERDWRDLETSDGQNALNLIKDIKTKGKLTPTNYTFTSGFDSISNNRKYDCGCSDAYIWREYKLTYCEILLNESGKFTFNFLFKDNKLVFQDESGVFLTNQK